MSKQYDDPKKQREHEFFREIAYMRGVHEDPKDVSLNRTTTSPCLTDRVARGESASTSSTIAHERVCDLEKSRFNDFLDRDEKDAREPRIVDGVRDVVWRKRKSLAGFFESRGVREGWKEVEKKR